MKSHKTVDEYIEKNERWKAELSLLRKTLLKTELQETVKWGAPVYTIAGKNVVGLGAFKSYVALWFFQGALLSDPHNKLINAQEGVTKALRQWRFNDISEIDGEWILQYTKEAIDHQKAGREIKPQAKAKLELPPELKNALAQDNELAEQFKKLTDFKRREFAEYIAGAKRAATKMNRLEKIKPMILAGIGLNDKYR